MMKIGDIILVPFPFAELTSRKVRPAVVITETADKYRDIVVSAISSVVPEYLSKHEIMLKPDKINNLRVVSVLKADRIVTLKREEKIADLGSLPPYQLQQFKTVLAEMVK